MVCFEWHIRGHGFDERSNVEVRCNNALDRGISFPSCWKTSTRCAGLATLATESGQRARTDANGAECIFLGRPRPSPLPLAGATCVPGAVAQLQTRTGARQDYLLAAHVDGARWFCHKGWMVNDELDDDDPFAPEKLELKDILRDAYEPEFTPRLRVCARVKGVELLDKARSRMHSWSNCVARAGWKAEEIRAAHRPFNNATASAGYEANPFKWESDGRLSQACVAFAWSWQDSGFWKREVVEEQIKNLTIHNRNVPTPLALRRTANSHNAELQRKLQSAAPPGCKYKGEKHGDCYEPDPAKWTSTSTSEVMVWYEWEHVLRGEKKEAHRVSIKVNNIIHGNRKPPQNPLGKSSPSNLYFTVEFMTAFGERVCPGMIYEGIAYEGDNPELRPDVVPNGGLDIQDSPVHWTLPCGRAVCWSLNDLKDMRADEFTAEQSDEAYEGIGREMRWDVLGIAEDSAITTFRDKPGTLAEKKWLDLSWHMPEKETQPCWWLVNPKDDPSKPPSLLCRALACVRLELNSTRVASSSKLRQTYERRAEDNSKAVDVLHHNQHLWQHVCGPDPETLFRPSAEILEKCHKACERLERMLETKSDACDGLDEYASEITRAVESLKSLEWEAIRTERFSMTPPALYSELVRNAEALLQKQAEELIRRQEWLAAPVDPLEDPCVEVKHREPDKYGINLDEFRMKSGRKPALWKDAIKIASWIHIDEIRSGHVNKRI